MSLSEIEYIEKNFKILTKANKRGLSELVPLKLWKPQRHYLENRTNRDIILKNRQVGMSSGVMAGNTAKVFMNKNNRMNIVTHNQETSEFLLQTVHRFHRNMPEKERNNRLKTDWRSAARIRFPDIDSYIYIHSAEAKAIGIGHTLNIAHASEFSRWSDKNARDLYAGISQTVPLTGFITIEFTAYGRGNLAYEMYDAAKKNEIDYKVFFYPWWWDVTCVMPIFEVQTPYSKEEQDLIKLYDLKPEQIAFRRYKIRELGDLFYQEYPENDIDCWLSSDMSVFDGTAIRRYLMMVDEGRNIGEHLTIWEDVMGGESYIIGIDTAGGNEKGDYSCASVIRTRTMKYVARFRAKMPPDMFAHEVMKLGFKYNEALLGVERQMHGHMILGILIDNAYPNLYYHSDYDAVLGKVSQFPGWSTTSKTKPLMIDDFSKSLRANELISFSENLMLEASGVTWDGANKIKHPKGAYDDELDAVMIALQLRENEPIYESKRQESFSYARW